MKSIRPSEVSGVVVAPPSKSMMQRAVAASLLAAGTSEISNPSFCDDSLAAIGIAETLGARAERANGQGAKGKAGCPERLLVTGKGTDGMPKGRVLDCNESGLCMRMFAPIAALFGTELTLTARGSLASRPVGMMEKPLGKLGAECRTDNGLPPVLVKGPMKGGLAVVDGATSSQFLSGLLMALPLCRSDSELLALNLKSRPYVEMTLSLLEKYGLEVSHENVTAIRDVFFIRGNQRYNAAPCEIEGDWSGAAFMLVAGAVAGNVSVSRLKKGSKQADKAIIDVLKMAGAEVSETENSVTVGKRSLDAFEFNATDCPDLFPPLAALACGCKGKSAIHGAGRLVHKESDRAGALVREFAKMGAGIRAAGDMMEITGKKLKGGMVDSHNDHRIAMACAIAGLNSQTGVEIADERCVSKSYPNFFGDLERIMVNGSGVGK